MKTMQLRNSRTVSKTRQRIGYVVGSMRTNKSAFELTGKTHYGEYVIKPKKVTPGEYIILRNQNHECLKKITIVAPVIGEVDFGGFVIKENSDTFSLPELDYINE